MLVAFLGSGYVVNLWNRSGDVGAGQSARDFFEQSYRALGEGFRVRRVLCDSGFYDVRFIEYLESGGHSYIIAAPMLTILQAQISKIEEWKWIAKGVAVGEFSFEHKDIKWDRLRRYIVVRQEVNKRPKAAGKQLSLFCRPSEFALLAVFFFHILKNTFDFREKLWYFSFYYVPHNVNFYTKIVVYQFVSCSGNVFPRYIRIIFLHLFRQCLYSLSHDFNISDYGILGLVVLCEISVFYIVRIGDNSFDALFNISNQINVLSFRHRQYSFLYHQRFL